MLKRVLVTDVGGSKDLLLKFGIKNSSLLLPPYESILNSNVLHLATLPQNNFVKNIAIEMKKMILEGKNINIPKDKIQYIKKYLTSSYVYSSYNFAYKWIFSNFDIKLIRHLIRENFS
jgi:hypothetical protein